MFIQWIGMKSGCETIRAKRVLQHNLFYIDQCTLFVLMHFIMLYLTSYILHLTFSYFPWFYGPSQHCTLTWY